MTGTKTRTPRRRAAAINAAVSVSRSKGRYSATRLPALKVGNRAMALAASLERERVIGRAQGAPLGAQLFT